MREKEDPARHTYVRERAAGPGEELPERPNETAARERLYARRHARIGVPVPSDEALEQYAAKMAAQRDHEKGID